MLNTWSVRVHDFIGKTGLADRYLGIGEVGDGAIPQFAALEPLPLPVNRYDPPTWHGFTLEEVAHLREAFRSDRFALADKLNWRIDARGPLTHARHAHDTRVAQQHSAPNSREHLIHRS